MRTRLARSPAAASCCLLECRERRAMTNRSTALYETCRPRSLAGDRPIMDATRPERRLIYTVREHVDLVIDTSNLTAAELKRLLTGHFAPRDPRLRVFITFFAYRDRVPRNSDLILDVHFLDNPHYRSELCALTGHDGAVAANGEETEASPQSCVPSDGASSCCIVISRDPAFLRRFRRARRC